MKFIVSTIQQTIGMILLLLLLIFFIVGLIFKTIVDILTYFEVELGKLMKKCLGTEL
tara:strand:+ start:2015 stop:2185 length:171 start_codon:yes stop_codon:yes gene_type:complete